VLDCFEIQWPIIRGRLRSQSGYYVFAGLCNSGVVSHDDKSFQLLYPKGGTLVARMPMARCTQLLHKVIDLQLGSDIVCLGRPALRAIVPSTALRAPLVVIKNADSDQKIYKSVSEVLDSHKIACRIQINSRGVLRIRDNLVVGYGVTLTELNETGSLMLQATGLGGKRSMGCGVFEPC
jgi:CRISPR-associated protein Cas6